MKPSLCPEMVWQIYSGPIWWGVPELAEAVFQPALTLCLPSLPPSCPSFLFIGASQSRRAAQWEDFKSSSSMGLFIRRKFSAPCNICVFFFNEHFSEYSLRLSSPLNNNGTFFPHYPEIFKSSTVGWMKRWVGRIPRKNSSHNKWWEKGNFTDGQ